jgi:hypothetical protein
MFKYVPNIHKVIVFLSHGSPRGSFGHVWKQFWLSQLGRGCASGMWWVELGSAFKRPTMRRTPP